MSDAINVPGVGAAELPQTALTDLRLHQVLAGLLVPSQGMAKAMARRILNDEAGRPRDAAVPL